jgi:thiosulfate/3-mercaptopyruvate sulfurtransferase
MPVLDADGAAGLPARGVLLDARAAARYRGEVEPIDPRAGTSPVRARLRARATSTPQGRFLARDALRERFAEVGLEARHARAAYCGSGVTAAHEVAALATRRDRGRALRRLVEPVVRTEPDRPVATGGEPG